MPRDENARAIISSCVRFPEPSIPSSTMNLPRAGMYLKHSLAQGRRSESATRGQRRARDIEERSVVAIVAAYEAGLRHFGENRVQEWETKLSKVAHLDATWHLIGHLQRNKAR